MFSEGSSEYLRFLGGFSGNLLGLLVSSEELVVLVSDLLEGSDGAHLALEVSNSSLGLSDSDSSNSDSLSNSPSAILVSQDSSHDSGEFLGFSLQKSNGSLNVGLSLVKMLSDNASLGQSPFGGSSLRGVLTLDSGGVFSLGSKERLLGSDNKFGNLGGSFGEFDDSLGDSSVLSSERFDKESNSSLVSDRIPRISDILHLLDEGSSDHGKSSSSFGKSKSESSENIGSESTDSLWGGETGEDLSGFSDASSESLVEVGEGSDLSLENSDSSLMSSHGSSLLGTGGLLVSGMALRGSLLVVSDSSSDSLHVSSRVSDSSLHGSNVSVESDLLGFG